MCPECGSRDLEIGNDRSSAFDLYQDWISLFLKASGAPILSCGNCRIEFYDRRRVLTRQPDESSNLRPSA
jgi:hypothetical protein